MRKILKKCAALGLGAVMLLSVAGCGLGQDDSVLPTFNVSADQLSDLDLKDLYNEQLGYSYKGVSYDLDVEGVGAALGVDMGDSRKLGGTEYTCYYPQEAATTVNGQVPVTMEFVFGGDKKFRSATYQFMANGNGMNAESLDALFDQTLDQLHELYGKETELRESSDESGSNTLDSVTYNWKQDMNDGYITSLQLVKGDYGYGTDIVILGVIRYTYEDEAEAQSAESTEE